MLAACTALLSLVAAGPTVTDDAAYQREIEAWPKSREARLRRDEGWLAVAGLHRAALVPRPQGVPGGGPLRPPPCPEEALRPQRAGPGGRDGQPGRRGLRAAGPGAAPRAGLRDARPERAVLHLSRPHERARD